MFGPGEHVLKNGSQDADGFWTEVAQSPLTVYFRLCLNFGDNGNEEHLLSLMFSYHRA
jgi:hypothetical protein